MKSRPIIFSTESVRAILEGRKTQTRRVLKPQPFIDESGNFCSPLTANELKQKKRGMHNWGQGVDGKPWLKEFVKKCPFGIPGDWLWVRETWRPRDPCIDDCGHVDYCTCPCFGDYRYAAEYSDAVVQDYGPWKSPMFMPKTASRITLEIVSIKAERLQDISDSDAKAEGYQNIATFIDAWDTLNAKRGFSWESNPWVWVIEFKKL